MTGIEAASKDGIIASTKSSRLSLVSKFAAGTSREEKMNGNPTGYE